MEVDPRINEELIEARIREIHDAVQMLGKLTSRDYSRMSVYEILSMRYLVIQLVEAASSICIHILIAAFDEKPEGFPECFSRLAKKGVLPEDLAEKLASAARLRNLLVHRYWTIRDEVVHKSVREGLRDFEEFVTCVRRFLERGRS